MTNFDGFVWACYKASLADHWKSMRTPVRRILGFPVVFALETALLPIRATWIWFEGDPIPFPRWRAAIYYAIVGLGWVALILRAIKFFGGGG